MTEQPKGFVQQARVVLYALWDWLIQFLQATGLLPQPPTQAISELARVGDGAHVSASGTF